jgi:NAD(P)H-dependent FMN reductase
MATERLHLAIIIGSTRTGRLGPTVAAWFAARAAARDDFAVDVIDLADVNEVAALGPRLDAADAFVVITPEYNHSFPAPLKHAIDAFSVEWRAKPLGFVSYGGASGGLRAVEQLRQVFAELHGVTVRDTVSLHGIWQQIAEGGQQLVPDAGRDRAAARMLDRLSWWARVLRTARRTDPYAA